MQNNFTDAAFPAYARALQEKAEEARRFAITHDSVAEFVRLGGKIEAIPGLQNTAFDVLFSYHGVNIGTLAIAKDHDGSVILAGSAKLNRINRQIEDAQ